MPARANDRWQRSASLESPRALLAAVASPRARFHRCGTRVPHADHERAACARRRPQRARPQPDARRSDHHVAPALLRHHGVRDAVARGPMGHRADHAGGPRRGRGGDPHPQRAHGRHLLPRRHAHGSGHRHPQRRAPGDRAQPLAAAGAAHDEHLHRVHDLRGLRGIGHDCAPAHRGSRLACDSGHLGDTGDPRARDVGCRRPQDRRPSHGRARRTASGAERPRPHRPPPPHLVHGRVHGHAVALLLHPVDVDPRHPALPRRIAVGLRSAAGRVHGQWGFPAASSAPTWRHTGGHPS